MKHIYLKTSVILFAIGFLGACDSPKEPKPDRSPDRPSVPATPIEPEKEEIPDIERSQVVDLVKQWLKAQNEGEFSTYLDVYADTMVGIKRVGQEVSEFDRDGWERDRKRMFDDGVEVSITEPEVRVSPRLAVVEFEQTFKSGKFTDRGPKRLVIQAMPAGPRIIREEMLESEVLSREGQNDHSRLGLLSLTPVIEDRFVVLERNPDDGWGRGQARFASEGVAVRPVNRGQIPEKYRRYENLTVTVHTEDATTCKSSVDALRMVARAEVPEEVLREGFEGKSGPDALFEVAGTHAVLAARLKTACPGAIAATAEFNESMRVARFERVDEAPVDALEDWRQGRTWQQLQREYEKEGKDGFWDHGPAIYVARFGDDTGLLVLQGEHGERCGGFYGTHFAVYRMEGEDLTRLTTPEADRGIIEPKIAVDFQKKGTEILGMRDFLMAQTDKNLSIVQDVRPPSLFCPC